MNLILPMNKTVSKNIVLYINIPYYNYNVIIIRYLKKIKYIIWTNPEYLVLTLYY